MGTCFLRRLPGLVVESPLGLSLDFSVLSRRSMVAAFMASSFALTSSVKLSAPSISREGTSSAMKGARRLPQIHPAALAATSTADSTAGPYIVGCPALDPLRCPLGGP